MWAFHEGSGLSQVLLLSCGARVFKARLWRWCHGTTATGSQRKKLLPVLTNSENERLDRNPKVLLENFRSSAEKWFGQNHQIDSFRPRTVRGENYGICRSGGTARDGSTAKLDSYRDVRLGNVLEFGSAVFVPRRRDGVFGSPKVFPL